jgi:hypothetical protein
MSQLLGDDKSGKIKTLDDLFVSLTGRTINETV